MAVGPFGRSRHSRALGRLPDISLVPLQNGQSLPSGTKFAKSLSYRGLPGAMHTCQVVLLDKIYAWEWITV